MKNNRSFRKSLLACLLALTCLVPVGAASAQTITASVGTGDSVSYLVIEAALFGAPLVYAYHYTYDAENPFDTYFLMTEVAKGVSDLSFSFTDWGSPETPNFYLNSITYNTMTLTGTSTAPYLYWAQWVSGGEAGYPFAVPVADGTWEFGSGPSAPSRYVQPGSWDAFVYGDGNARPSVAPVPEPASVSLVAVGGVLMIWVARRRQCGVARLA